MPTFSYRASFGATRTNKPKVNVAAFGDGYSQRSARGINNNPDSWAVSFNNLDEATKTSIDTLLSSWAGVSSFTWVDPEGNTGLYLCSSWQVISTDEDDWSISAVFDQVYGG